jgi:hypothetical protein
MSEQTKLALPGNGYDLISQVLQAYALSGGGEKPLALEAVASRAGIHSTQVSRNTGFLVSVGLLTRGKSKSLTQDGLRLAIALRNKVEDDASDAWKRVILKSSYLRAILDMISIRGQIDKDALPGRIASTLGIAFSGKHTTAGINALIEIFKIAGVVEEAGNNYRLTPNALADVDAEAIEGDDNRATEGDTDEAKDLNNRGAGSIARQPSGATTSPQGNFNLHVHISADANPEQVDALFASIARHFYGSNAKGVTGNGSEDVESSEEIEGGEE